MAAGAVRAAGQIIWAQWPLIQLSLASAPATEQISAGRKKAASCHRCSRSVGTDPSGTQAVAAAERRGSL